MPLNRRRFMQSSALVGGAFVGAGVVESAPDNNVAPNSVDGATAVDVLFNAPYIDKDEWRDTPYRHRYVHGGFVGTDARFAFYFPPKDKYEGRFFQLNTPVPMSENSAEGVTGEGDFIGFALDSGGYFVRSNQGGLAATGSPGSPIDGSIAGYRVNAAAAEYSRKVAMEMYGTSRPYGYAFGGSGGSYRTIGGFENTQAWDGAVPFVMPTAHAVPTMFTVRLLALRLVGDKMDQVVDAVDAGGSGDMYAGLNEEEAAGLREATRMGFPPRTWFLWRTMGWGPFSNVYDLTIKADPSYLTEFWRVPGYLGANPNDALLRARIQHRARVKRVITTENAADAGLPPPYMGYTGSVDAPTTQWRNFQNQWSSRPFPVAFELENPPPSKHLQGAKITIKEGAEVSVARLRDKILMILFTPVSGSQLNITGGVKTGDELVIDNSNVLAMDTYHRHAVPPPEYIGWDQFRGPDGKPKYPQRARLVGPLFAISTAGSMQTGKFKGKMIVVQSMMDEDAVPVQAEWYRNLVRKNYGAAADDKYRIYFTDCALHTSDVAQASPTRTVSYRGMLHQALRDLSAWVEKGVAPPDSTSYQIDKESQVVLASTAAKRKGIQPVVTLTANGKARADVRVGEAVQFDGAIEAPPKTGSIVSAEWDVEGSGRFAEVEKVNPAARVEVRKSHTFTSPGTYFVTLRGAGQRAGNAETPYARIYNLARARVVVT